MKRLIPLVLVVASACLPKTGGSGSPGTVPTGKLPTDVTPTHYRLHLDIDPRKDTFSGETQIEARLNRPARFIWMHGNGLRIRTAEAIPDGGQPVRASWEQVSPGGIARLTFDRILAPGKITLHFVYDADFNRALAGLYLVEHDGRRYAFSQLEELDARRVFPGFDEPRFKTPFDVSITASDEDVVATNAPAVTERSAPGGRKRITFATTPPLPTYLLAWAVGPLDVVDADPIPANDVRDRPIPLRGLVPAGRGDQMKIALARTPELLEMLEQYTGIAYPFAKLDLVAVPDFGAGAMENPGLITFRETRILLDPEAASLSSRKHFTTTDAHELAHMWFGDLVTTAWWDDIWLNEAFASWMEARVVDAWKPAWDHDLDFVSGTRWAMGADSLATVRRVREPIRSDHDIRNAFDSITYTKGAAVLTMFEAWLGPETFRRGVQHYLRTNANTSTTYEAFTASMSEVAGQPLHEAFSSFLDQPGVPLLDMSVSCRFGKTTVSVQQSRYLPVGSTGSSSETWQVPVCLRWSADGKLERTCKLVTREKAKIELPVCADWIFPNADATGYYRWSLDDASLSALREHGVEHLSTRELISLVDAVGAAFHAGRLSYSQALEILLPLAAHEDRHIATAPMGLLRFAHAHTDGQTREKVERLARNTYGPVWELMSKKDTEPELRLEVARFLAFVARDPDVRTTLNEMGTRFLGYGTTNKIDRYAVEPELVATAVTVTAEEGGEELFDYLLAKLKTETNGTVRDQLLHGLAAFTDPALAEKTRALPAVPGLLRANEKSTLISLHNQQEANREPTWAWLKENIEAIRAAVPPYHLSYLPGLASGFETRERAQEVEAFFEPFIDEIPGGPRVLATTLERITLSAALVDAQKDDVVQYYEHLDI